MKRRTHSKGRTWLRKLGFPFQPRVQRGSVSLAALHFHTQGTLLVLDDGECTHAHLQLLFELLKRGFVILKLNSHFIYDLTIYD